MDVRVGVGSSEDIDEGEEAGREAARTALDQLGGEARVALVFASIDFDQAALMAGLKAALGDLPMVGCTTDGEISPQGTHRDSVTVMVLGGADLHATVGVATGLTASPEVAAQALSSSLQARAPADARLMICLPDSSTTGNILAVLDGVKAVFGRDFPIFGGLPGDKQRLTGKTFQYCNYQVYSDAMPALVLSGRFGFVAGLSSGVRPLGAKAVCTRAEGSLILEIDEHPAIDHHRRYVGEEVMVPATIANFPYLLLAGQAADGEDAWLVRTPFFYVPQNGAIACAAPIPEGVTLQIGRCTRESILEGATLAAERLHHQLGGREAKALLVFSCSGRKQQLGIEVEREMANITRVLGAPVPTAGFYCYGEIGPMDLADAERESEYHGYTVSMLALTA